MGQLAKLLTSWSGARLTDEIGESKLPTKQIYAST